MFSSLVIKVLTHVGSRALQLKCIHARIKWYEMPYIRKALPHCLLYPILKRRYWDFTCKYIDTYIHKTATYRYKHTNKCVHLQIYKCLYDLLVIAKVWSCNNLQTFYLIHSSIKLMIVEYLRRIINIIKKIIQFITLCHFKLVSRITNQ